MLGKRGMDQFILKTAMVGKGSPPRDEGIRKVEKKVTTTVNQRYVDENTIM
jgi:hypothetical protein